MLWTESLVKRFRYQISGPTPNGSTDLLHTAQWGGLIWGVSPPLIFAAGQHPLPCPALHNGRISSLLTFHGIQGRSIATFWIATFFPLFKKEEQRDLASVHQEIEGRHGCFKECCGQVALAKKSGNFLSPDARDGLTSYLCSASSEAPSWHLLLVVWAFLSLSFALLLLAYLRFSCFLTAGLYIPWELTEFRSMSFGAVKNPRP